MNKIVEELEKNGKIILEKDDVFILFKLEKNKESKDFLITPLVPISEIGYAADILKTYYGCCLDGMIESNIEKMEEEKRDDFRSEPEEE